MSFRGIKGEKSVFLGSLFSLLGAGSRRAFRGSPVLSMLVTEHVVVNATLKKLRCKLLDTSPTGMPNGYGYSSIIHVENVKLRSGYLINAGRGVALHDAYRGATELSSHETTYCMSAKYSMKTSLTSIGLPLYQSVSKGVEEMIGGSNQSCQPSLQ